MNQKVVIVGLGLIGGSLAKAFRKYSSCNILGMDRDPETVRAALDCGAIDGEAREKDLEEADILYLCLYPQADIEFVKNHRKQIRPGCVVTDTCGVKSAVCPRLAALAVENGFFFVGGHPMAGREKNGFKASNGDLFLGASYILVPCGAPQNAVDTIKDVAAELRFGSIVVATPEVHDRMIAFTSQLPHALACAYVKSPQCPHHHGFSAGSYRDVSRVASINETLWTELFLDNRTALTQELDLLLLNLTDIRNALDHRDAESLRALLCEGRLIKERLHE